MTIDAEKIHSGQIGQFQGGLTAFAALGHDGGRSDNKSDNCK